MGSQISTVNVETSGISVGTTVDIHIKGFSKDAPIITIDRTLSPTQQLNSIKSTSIDVIKEIVDDIPERLAVIYCNSYDNSRMALGDCAKNDGIMAYEELSARGYKVYLFHDLKRSAFIESFKNALSIPTEQLVMYYIGHGTHVRDTNGDEDDGRDEAFVFSDGVVIDDYTKDLIEKNIKSKSLTVLCDCCHSGTIIDHINSSASVICVSACKDSQTAKQDWIERKGNGIFTHYFWKYIGKCTTQELIQKMSLKLRRYEQTMTIAFGTTKRSDGLIFTGQ